MRFCWLFLLLFCCLCLFVFVLFYVCLFVVVSCVDLYMSQGNPIMDRTRTGSGLRLKQLIERDTDGNVDRYRRLKN